jgi:hypothetical protein
MLILEKRSFLISCFIILVGFSFLVPSVGASTGATPASARNQLRFHFAGTSNTTENTAMVSGVIILNTGRVQGSGRVSDATGANGFTFRLESLANGNSICPQGGVENVNAIVTQVRGNGLRAIKGMSVAVLLGCYGSNSVTIILPSCVAGNPACEIAPIFHDTFWGKLVYDH